MKKLSRMMISLLLSVSMLLQIQTKSVYAESATSTLQEMYAQAELLMVTGDYSGAAAKFDALGAYSDASKMAMYCKAIGAAETLGRYDIAILALNDLGDFKDCKQLTTYYTARGLQAVGDSVDLTTASNDDLSLAHRSYDQGAKLYGELLLFKDCLTRMSECQKKSSLIEAEQSSRALNQKETIYQQALTFQENKEYQQAIDTFSKIQEYKDSSKRISVCQTAIKETIYQEALMLVRDRDYQKAIDTFIKIQDYKDSMKQIADCEVAIKEKIYEDSYEEALALEKSNEYEKASKIFLEIIDYHDSKEHIYQIVNQQIQENNYSFAIQLLKQLNDYKDSKELLKKAFYLEGLSLFHDRKYEMAIKAFSSAADYPNAKEMLITVNKELAYINLYKQVGGYVTFGAYPQTYSGDDNTPIEWIVLDYDVDNNKTLLISRYSLDAQRYNSIEKEVTWEQCTLRAWLNNEFYNRAFSPREQKAVLTTLVDNGKSQGYDKWNTNGGNNTYDKVFLLSYAEARKYFDVKHIAERGSTWNEKARVYCTGYAYNNGAYRNGRKKTTEGKDASAWWLRSPGVTLSDAATVSYEGALSEKNCSVNGKDTSVRPVIWIDLNMVAATN